MPDTPSIVVKKTFVYRNLPEEWSNKYHFLGDTPTTVAGWKALCIAIWNQERTFLGADVKLNGFSAYAAGNEVAVATMGPDDLSSGEKTTGQATGGTPPGDVAAWVRWATGERGSKGRPIYLRKYFHGVPYTSPDSLTSPVRTAMQTYAGKMTDGTLPGGFKICGPQGAPGGMSKVPQYVTTRTLKRRGKDPS